VLRTRLSCDFCQSVQIVGVRDELGYDNVVAGKKMYARHRDTQVAGKCSRLGLASTPATQQSSHDVLLEGKRHGVVLDVAEGNRRLPDPGWSVEDDQTGHPVNLDGVLADKRYERPLGQTERARQGSRGRARRLPQCPAMKVVGPPATEPVNLES
jgi:hypothetical protein